ncbi:MAG: RNA methyltransferase [Bacteroidales bacterium]|nr:RNA methyltransferase [Bacteroidales bacterium]
MVSNSELKFLRQLKMKKFRELNRAFVVEGAKVVQEVLNSSWKIHSVYATDKYLLSHSLPVEAKVITKTQSEQLTSFSTDAELYALVEMPDKKVFDAASKKILLLDAIRDAGNMGTIIRTADWFDIHAIVCSPDTVELYNPKTLQSTMGSFTRVDVFYNDLLQFMQEHKQYTYYGTFMQGNPIGECKFDEYAAIVLGSESHGISEKTAAGIQQKISIPLVGGTHRQTQPESLNVAVSAAICCYELNK